MESLKAQLADANERIKKLSADANEKRRGYDMIKLQQELLPRQIKKAQVHCSTSGSVGLFKG